MLKFILRDKPEKGVGKDGCELDIWKVVQVYPQPPKEVCGFEGSEHPDYYDSEIARALAGDYVEMLNEKYLDKNINEEWPIPDKKQYLVYHLQRVKELVEELC